MCRARVLVNNVPLHPGVQQPPKRLERVGNEHYFSIDRTEQTDFDCTEHTISVGTMSPIVSCAFPIESRRLLLVAIERQDIRLAVAGGSTRPTSFLAKSFTHDRRTCFMTFPLAVFGSSSGTPSSPANHTQAGAF